VHEDIHSVCASCGASVYKQHIDSGIARYEGGKLLCSHCVADYEKEHDSEGGGPAFAPIEFDDQEDRHEAMSSSRIHSASTAKMGTASIWDESKFKRPLRVDKDGSTRCRVFHCKLSEGSLEFMVNQINEWLEGNKDIVVKFASTNIGPFEGKHTEPNLIVTAFY
jgi:hypothetical protein